MTIIQLQKTNEKGDKVNYYTDSSYFNQNDLTSLQSVFAGACKFRTTASVIVGLVSYHAFNFVPAVRSSVTSKFSHRSAGSLLALGAAGLTYFLTSFAVISSVKSESQKIISRNSHPGWYNKQNVVNPQRVFFELDDHKDNQINIIHSGLNVNNVARLFPDFNVGQIPHKPHKPTQEVHHH